MTKMRSSAITKPLAVELGLQLRPRATPEQLGNPIIGQVELGELHPGADRSESAGGHGGVTRLGAGAAGTRNLAI